MQYKFHGVEDERIKRKKMTETLLQLVSFKVGNEEFGIDILKVREINRMMDLTSIPNSPDFVEGIINLRGRVIPVIDLRAKLQMSRKEKDNCTRIIVVEVREKTIGFIVDSVNEVLRISEDITEPPPELVAGINSGYVTAVGKLDDRLLILLDLEAMFSTEELSGFKAVA